jgi:uncharacterized protein (DUF1778 family)
MSDGVGFCAVPVPNDQIDLDIVLFVLCAKNFDYFITLLDRPAQANQGLKRLCSLESPWVSTFLS